MSIAEAILSPLQLEIPTLWRTTLPWMLISQQLPNDACDRYKLQRHPCQEDQSSKRDKNKAHIDILNFALYIQLAMHMV